jgi:hypothetical protein
MKDFTSNFKLMVEDEVSLNESNHIFAGMSDKFHSV